VRKILKKYDKIIEKYAVDSDFNDEKLREDLNNISPFVSSFSFNTDQGPDVHLQQLTNSESIAAITLSLLKASIKAGSMNILTMEQYLVHDETLLRFKCAIDCIDILREYANVVNQPFPAFLSRQAMIVTGYDLGGIEGMKQNALEVLLAFDPDTILHMDKLDLSEWQQRCWEYTFTSAGNKMRKTSFDLIEDANQAVRDRTLSWGGVDAPSMFINLMSILLYTVNYYIVAPTANRYASHLGAKGAFGSTIIGASSVAAIFSALVYSLWYSKLSMKSALIFSSLCPIVGNLMYIVALSQKSFKMALIGRVLVGFGSAEVVNRQLISSCVHLNYMTKASVGFVVAGALGMSIGPLLAAILDKYAGRDFEIDFSLPYVGGIIVDHVSSPGFLMAFLWFIQLLAVIFRFSEPFRINGRSDSKKKKKAESFVSRLKGTFGLVFSNPGLPLTLFVFAYVEMICEVLISSCAMVSKEYFGWKGSMAGFLIACLGALVLPAHFVVERTSRTFDERAIMKVSFSRRK
jgi:MFS family permease